MTRPDFFARLRLGATEMEDVAAHSKARANSAERITAERYGAASPEPLPVTPRGDTQAATLVEQFNATPTRKNRPPSPGVVEAQIRRLDGFDIFETVILPENGEKLVGFAAHPRGNGSPIRKADAEDSHGDRDAR